MPVVPKASLTLSERDFYLGCRVIDIADSDEEDPEASDGHDDVPSSVTEEAVEVADDGEDDQSDVCESEDEEEEDG